jgi:hypothetical protein
MPSTVVGFYPGEIYTSDINLSGSRLRLMLEDDPNNMVLARFAG